VKVKFFLNIVNIISYHIFVLYFIRHENLLKISCTGELIRTIF